MVSSPPPLPRPLPLACPAACLHWFCRECILGVLAANPRCPLVSRLPASCRVELSCLALLLVAPLPLLPSKNTSSPGLLLPPRAVPPRHRHAPAAPGHHGRRSRRRGGGGRGGGRGGGSSGGRREAQVGGRGRGLAARRRAAAGGARLCVGEQAAGAAEGGGSRTGEHRSGCSGRAVAGLEAAGRTCDQASPAGFSDHPTPLPLLCASLATPQLRKMRRTDRTAKALM